MWTLTSLISLVLVAATPSDQFIFNNGAEPETLDPHRMSAHDAAQLWINMYEGLVVRDSTYSKIEPGIAAKWEISKDGKTYTFTLRPDLKWSNGEPLTADHVRNSFLRSMNPEVLNNFIQWYTDHIEGADAYVKNFKAPNKKEFEDKVGIKVVGKDKVEIKLMKSSVSFIQFLTQQAFSVVHPSMFDTSSDAWKTPSKFISNGPYKLKEWTVNKHVILEKNPYFREAKSVKIPIIVALPINEENVTLNLFKTQEIDWTGENTLSSSMIPSLRSSPEFRILPSFGTYMYLFNVKRKPFDNVKVRRALAMTINRAEIVDKIAKGGQQPTTRVVPPGIKDYKPLIAPPLAFDRQIEQAKKLLAEAGYPDGKGFPESTILYNTTEGHKKIAQAVQQMWKKYLNIDVKLQNQEWKVFLREQENKNFEISRQSWIMDVPDPANMLEIYISGGGNNHTNWSNPEFDRIIRETSSMKDSKKRFAELAKAEKIITDEAPIVPMYHYVFYSMISPRIEGFVPNGFGLYQFRYLAKK